MSQITKIRNEKKITTGFTEIKTIKKYSEQLYVKKLYNIDEIDKFLKKDKLLELTGKKQKT